MSMSSPDAPFLMPWLDGLRGAVRPVVTLSLTGLIIALGWTGAITTTECLALYGPILGFWFGQRSSGTAA